METSFNQKERLDPEWVQLFLYAKELGISRQELEAFLRKDIESDHENSTL
ncbi:hypothetical protein [Lederbergia graminis]|uniref:Sin domain-containing protein n=1 Tax=Lederbergia graminis TaxID=735518 RepID=A0ABW0LIN1_9BACI